MRRIILSIFSVLVVMTLFLVLCTFRVRPYEIVLINRFGTIIESPNNIAYGWCLCYPTDRLVRLDKRLHVYQSNLEEMQMSGETISVRVFAAWQIQPGKASVFNKRFQGSDEKAQGQLATQILGATNAIMARHHMDEIFNAAAAASGPAASAPASAAQTEQIEKEITDRVNADLLKADTGMQVAEIGFSRLAFPPMASEKIYARMSTERQGKAQRFINEGSTRSTEITAAADAKYEIDVNQAKREAEQIKAEADHKALQIIASMQQTPEARELYSDWKSLEIFKTSVNKGTVLVLTADDPIMRFLRPLNIIPQQAPPAPQH